MHDFDVIIIGGGPAGCATALHAGRAGLRVLLAEAAPFPRERICADSLSAVVVAAVRELGLEERLLELEHVHARDIAFHAGEQSVTVPVLKIDPGARATSMVCRRVLFDDMLLQAAREIDTVTVMTWCRVTDLQRGDDGWTVTMDRGGGRHLTCTARILVGADGARSLVARRMGVHHPAGDCILAVQAYYHQVIGLREHMEIHFPEELLPGYLWVHPTRTSLANVGLAMPLAVWKQRRFRPGDMLRHLLTGPGFRERFAFAEPDGRPRVRILPSGNPSHTVHGDGFLLVGDAAGLASPCSTEGIPNALISARLATRTLVEACRSGDSSASGLESYPGRLWLELGPRLELSRRLATLRTSGAISSLIRSATRRPHNAGWISGVLIGSALPSAELEDLLGYLAFFNR